LENVERDIKWVGESYSQRSLMEDKLLNKKENLCCLRGCFVM